jgi:predicted ATP-grasp superfamily ATP-dependent carboligase
MNRLPSSDLGQLPSTSLSAGPKTILVTDGDSRAALAVTRSLGRRGHRVIVGERRRPSLSHASRYCALAVEYPDPVHDEGAFVDALVALVEEHQVDVVLPVADITTALVTAHRERFGGRAKVPYADADVVSLASDKWHVLETARQCGTPIPASWSIARPGAPLPKGLPFPVVIKPHRSRVRTPDGWLSCTVGYAHDVPSLRRELAQRHPAQYPLILQERITGPGVGLFACYDGGRATALFSHRRLREKPPWGGVSVLAESVALEPDLVEAGTRLLDALGWHGIAMVEFKRDLRDGQPKLMEINARFWGSLQLAVDAGIDFPNILVDAALGHAPATPTAYRAGVRSRWFWGDLDALLLRVLGGRRQPVGWDRGSRLGAVLSFLKLWGRDLHYENPRFEDLGPWWHETRRWVRRSA